MVNAFPSGDIETYWTRVDAAVRDGVAAKSIPEIKELICDLLQETEEEELPRNDVVERPRSRTSASAAAACPSRLAVTLTPCTKCRSRLASARKARRWSS